MTVEDIFSILEREVAPVKLSDDFCAKFKMYDNSGIIINCGVPVTGALFALDLSENAVSKAEELGFNLIITKLLRCLFVSFLCFLLFFFFFLRSFYFGLLFCGLAV